VQAREPTTTTPVPVVVVMGVAGSGKTTVGRALAERLAWAYAEGDEFHPQANVVKMRSGVPLTDADREPWLDAIALWLEERLARRQPGVVACSALKRSYRDRLRRAAPDLRVVYLDAPRDVLSARIERRVGHFFPGTLLDSQLAALERPDPSEHAIAVDVSEPLDRVVSRIVEDLERPASGA
jgi:carbohydrate kinase (thermoresistant glucokinase family)